MLLTIRRWRAAVVGVILLLAAHSGARVSAGIVDPPKLRPQPAADQSSPRGTGGITVSLPLPASNGETQPFWFPGADGIEAVSISSVPVHSSVGSLDTPAFPGTQQHPLIPLPGAAWTGMAGLLGLGAVKVLRNLRRLLA